MLPENQQPNPNEEAGDTIANAPADVCLQREIAETRSALAECQAFCQRTGGFVHELNNLLTVINGYSELGVYRLAAADPNRELFAQIKQTGDRAALLVRQLLALSRKVTAAGVTSKAASARFEITCSAGTVLLVEDEDAVRKVAYMILKTLGYHVLEARDGPEALRVARDYVADIHLLLSDIVMPGMSGPQLAAALAPVRPEMRVLFMSGYPDEYISRLGESPHDFLHKPITSTILTRKVREVLDRTGAAAEGGRQPILVEATTSRILPMNASATSEDFVDQER